MKLSMVFFLGIVLVLIFSAIIWLREWYGSGKTIYNIMTIPASKHKIIIAKYMCAILILCTYISTQIICFFVDGLMIKKVLFPYSNEGFIFAQYILGNNRLGIIPENFEMFILYLLAILSLILVVFNVVMLYKSSSIKGIVFYCVFIVIMISAYIYFPTLMKMFVMESLICRAVISLLFMGLNYFSCYYLFKNKVHV